MQDLYNRRPNTLIINNHKNPESITHINALELPKEKWDKRCPNGFNTYHCYRNTGLKAESKRAMTAILDKILATTSYWWSTSYHQTKRNHACRVCRRLNKSSKRYVYKIYGERKVRMKMSYTCYSRALLSKPEVKMDGNGDLISASLKLSKSTF